MGGEERTNWALWPEHDAVLIGTEDMLLSRALNRGRVAADLAGRLSSASSTTTACGSSTRCN